MLRKSSEWDCDDIEAGKGSTGVALMTPRVQT